MDETVGCADFAAGQVKVATAEIGHDPAGFAHQHHAGSCIPRVEVEFPKTVVAATGDAGQIESRRAGTAHAVRPQRQALIKVNVRILVTLLAGKTGGEQAFSE